MANLLCKLELAQLIKLDVARNVPVRLGFAAVGPDHSPAKVQRKRVDGDTVFEIGDPGGETQPDRDIPRYIQLYQLGKLKLAEQISHRYSLDDVNEAVSAVRKGEALRCLISL